MHVSFPCRRSAVCDQAARWQCGAADRAGGEAAGAGAKMLRLLFRSAAGCWLSSLPHHPAYTRESFSKLTVHRKMFHYLTEERGRPNSPEHRIYFSKLPPLAVSRVHQAKASNASSFIHQVYTRAVGWLCTTWTRNIIFVLAVGYFTERSCKLNCW